MSSILRFHNDYHLGDCLYQLHYLIRHWRASFQSSTLYCNPDYHDELSAFIPIGYDIRLADIEDKAEDSINCWIGHEEFHTSHPNWHDYPSFYVDFFKHLSKKAGIRSPIVQKGHMLFDSPEIHRRRIPKTHYDFLIINAQPKSGQWPHNESQFLNLITSLRNARKRVITTHPCGIQNVPATIHLGYKIIDIAKLSTQVQNIIGIDTGPMGSTFNIWNQTTVKNRFILHDTNYFTHDNCYRVHKWADLVPAGRRSGCLNPTTN
jgi:hypothetical protein